MFEDDPVVENPGIDPTSPKSTGSGKGGYEAETYKFKDLKDIKLPALPRDAVGFRTWRNAILTHFGSIDRTGESRILRWLQACLLPEATDSTVVQLQMDPQGLPRLGLSNHGHSSPEGRIWA